MSGRKRQRPARPARVWVVEIQFDGTGPFVPCAECELTKRLALSLIEWWRESGDDNDRYRVACYVRAPQPRKRSSR